MAYWTLWPRSLPEKVKAEPFNPKGTQTPNIILAYWDSSTNELCIPCEMASTRFFQPRFLASGHGSGHGFVGFLTGGFCGAVRKAAIEATAAVAGMAIAHGNEQWPNLLNCMSMLSTSQHEEHREAGLMMFCSLTESVGRLLVSKLSHHGIR